MRDTGRFAGKQSGRSKLDDCNPFLLRDYDLCISCYRCVRVCAEQEGDYAISVANRGFQTQIVTEFDGIAQGFGLHILRTMRADLPDGRAGGSEGDALCRRKIVNCQLSIANCQWLSRPEIPLTIER